LKKISFNSLTKAKQTIKYRGKQQFTNTEKKKMPRQATAITLPELKLCKNRECGSVATGFSGFCYSCDSSRTIREYSTTPKPRATVKNPMGVEIECYNPENVRKVTHVARYVCRDGSLPSGGGEIKLCTTENKLEDVAADTVQRSRIVGNRVNKKCGLHLHMQIAKLKELSGASGGYFSNERYAVADRLMQFVTNVQEFMFDIVPSSRKRNNYCSTVRNRDYLFSHHSWITMSSHLPTLEIRIHSGTMNPWKIKGWINAWKQVRPDLDKIAAGEEGWEDVAAGYRYHGFLNKLSLDSIGYKYVLARETHGGKLENFGFSRAVAG
jgi:hypothetical protein